MSKYFAGGRIYKLTISVLFTFIVAGRLSAITWDMQEKITGDATQAFMGRSVSDAGDINGDGYMDFLIGMYGRNRVYIYFGGPQIDSVPDVVLSKNYGSFGISVSTAGDVNGDGYDDVIVGAPYTYVNGYSQAGAVYIYFGGENMDAVDDVVMVGDSVSRRLGWSVSSAGDVNGDGYDDVIVGQFNWGIGGAFVYYGGANMDSIPDVIMPGVGNDHVGYSVSNAGDVNGDGYDDVILGVPYYDITGHLDVGAAYLLYGGSSMDSIPDVKMVGESYGMLGWSVSNAGDINKDGYADVIVGRPNLGPGYAYIFYGDSSMDSIPDIIMIGEADYDNFGSSVSAAGDLNGDGYDDVIVGAKNNDKAGSNSGAAYVFYGGYYMDSVYDAKMTGESADDLFGKSVSGAGDVNGDGYDDVLVGAQYHDTGSYTDAGAAYLYDFFMFKGLNPGGAEVWNVGAIENITWKGKDAADIYISTDGGANWERIVNGVIPPEDTNYNVYTYRVPHIPTRYAMLKVVKWNYSPDRRGYYICSDSFFTIKSSITLLKFTAEKQDNEVNLKWKTEPGLEALSGYNLYRVRRNGNLEKINDSLLKVNSFKDVENSEAIGYKLGVVNGLGEEYRVGEVEYFNLKKPVEIMPSLIRNTVNVRFVVPENYLLSGKREVNVFVVNTEGRVVKKLFNGLMEAGIHEITDQDVQLASGYYFLVVKIDNSTMYKGTFQVFGE